METEQTHYIDDVDAPEWERKFSFVVSRPYTANTLWFKVYDYDGGFDELIGQVQIKCEDLEIHEGMVKPPPARWHTLLDLEGNEKTPTETRTGRYSSPRTSTRSTSSTCTCRRCAGKMR